MKCAKKSKVSKLTPYRKIGTREMTGLDWSVFAPVSARVIELLKDGKARSTTEVMDALGTKSNANTHRVLRSLTEEGHLIESFEKKDRHAVSCFRLAYPRRGRRNGLVPKGLPAKRG